MQNLGGGQTKSIMVFSEVAYLDCRKLLHCEFQKFGVIALYLEGGQIKQHANSSYKATKHIERTF